MKNLTVSLDLTKSCIKKVLNDSLLRLNTISEYQWSLQGMGLLRLYLNDNYRLHIWDSRFRAPGVSMIHDHLQWAFDSTVIAGRVVNIKYNMNHGPGMKEEDATHKYQTMRAGYNCIALHSPRLCQLWKSAEEICSAGVNYHQEGFEVHETDALDGTVTLMHKFPTQNEAQKDTARVFWKANEEWGSAEPRIASQSEVSIILTSTLERWF